MKNSKFTRQDLATITKFREFLSDKKGELAPFSSEWHNIENIRLMLSELYFTHNPDYESYHISDNEACH